MAVSTYSPNLQTKQQLEELDLLLQRMLALPTSDAGPSAALSTPPEAFVPSPPTLPMPARSAPPDQSVLHAWRVQNPAGDSSVIPFPAQQPPLATPVDSPEPRFVVNAAASAPPAASYPYQMVFGPQTAAAAPVLTPGAAPKGIPAPQWVAPKASASSEPLPFMLLPLYVLNKLFDLLTFPLGPIGTWLRQPAGRNTLGWLGVLMILAAIGWGVADWYGLDWLK